MINLIYIFFNFEFFLNGDWGLGRPNPQSPLNNINYKIKIIFIHIFILYKLLLNMNYFSFIITIVNIKNGLSKLFR